MRRLTHLSLVSFLPSLLSYPSILCFTPKKYQNYFRPGNHFGRLPEFGSLLQDPGYALPEFWMVPVHRNAWHALIVTLHSVFPSWRYCRFQGCDLGPRAGFDAGFETAARVNPVPFSLVQDRSALHKERTCRLDTTQQALGDFMPEKKASKKDNETKPSLARLTWPQIAPSVTK